MIVTSNGMLKMKGLAAMLEEPVVYCHDPRIKFSNHKTIAGWGRKPSFAKAKDLAEKHQLELYCLEDGFIRSLGLGKHGAEALSIVKDRSGIYFDSTQMSDLEKLIQQEEDATYNALAKVYIEKIKAHGISKYNLPYQTLDADKFSSQKNILIVDQTFGDQSIQYAQANAQTFKFMLSQALQDHPHATIWVKTHPDVVAGKAEGHFSLDDLMQPRVKVIQESYSPYELLDHMAEVYVVSSHFGFEALLNGNVVKSFGLAWYTGWGLTDDTYAPIKGLNGRRQQSKSLAHLFYCAYMQYAVYVSPITGQKTDLGSILELLATNIYFQNKLKGAKAAYGFSRWKRKFIREYLNFPISTLQFYNVLKPKKESAVVAWGNKARKLIKQNYQNVWTVEDGFVRSNGLGANLVRPYSLVFDNVGIYYDATRASRLEHILNTLHLNEDEKRRAQSILKLLIELNITKYNVGDKSKLVRPNADRVLLVTGQVEDDLSVQLGGVDIKTNLDLLKAVRAKNPDAYIIYKPHPDVHAGLRVGKIDQELIDQYANQVELTASILECLEISDELHTISSLSGFEALLRGVKVVCYGLPFYAGWGLTTDTKRCPRRTKNLNIEELIYGVLVKYALYNLPTTADYGVPLVNVEDVIAHVSEERQLGISSPILQSTFANIRAKLIYGRKK